MNNYSKKINVQHISIAINKLILLLNISACSNEPNLSSEIEVSLPEVWTVETIEGMDDGLLIMSRLVTQYLCTERNKE